MTSVNPGAAPDRHLALLMGRLYRRLAAVFDGEDWGGLRQSHFRVLAALPGEGASVTDLAHRIGVTKQGCGQLVTTLVGSAHLEVGASPYDGRVRLVRRTTLGTRTHRAVNRRVAALEAEWAALVGEERYATFSAVLAELTTDDA